MVFLQEVSRKGAGQMAGSSQVDMGGGLKVPRTHIALGKPKTGRNSENCLLQYLKGNDGDEYACVCVQKVSVSFLIVSYQGEKKKR